MEPYSPPVIRKLGPGENNPHRHGRSRVCPRIDGVPVEELLERFGSPLFVFSESTLRERIRAAREAFESRYPDVCFAWSYKTNYLDAVCRVFHDEGSIAEVVSDFEYEKARNNGMPGDRIIFNGPWKSEAALARAVEEGAMIQVDHRDEMLALMRLGHERGEPVPVALRIHLDTGTHAPWSKFGFSGDDGQALRMIRWAAGEGGVRIRGLHCHVGTFMLDASAYSVAARRLVELALAAEQAGAGPIEYLNLGGGFASRARLHGQYLPPEQATPSFDDYAEAIAPVILEHWPEGRKPPRLFLESGRALVDDAGFLLSTVVAVKQRRHPAAADPSLAAYGKEAGLDQALAGYGKEANGACGAVCDHQPAVVVDAGVNLLYTTAWYRPNVHPAVDRGGVSPTTVFGCLCMNIDVLREETPLPEMRPGDPLVIHPVGAYNWTQSMQFISYRPAIAMIDPDCGVHLIRRREQLEDVRGPEEVPEHLWQEQCGRSQFEEGKFRGAGEEDPRATVRNSA